MIDKEITKQSIIIIDLKSLIESEAPEKLMKKYLNKDANEERSGDSLTLENKNKQICSLFEKIGQEFKDIDFILYSESIFYARDFIEDF